MLLEVASDLGLDASEEALRRGGELEREVLSRDRHAKANGIRAGMAHAVIINALHDSRKWTPSLKFLVEQAGSLKLLYRRARDHSTWISGTTYWLPEIAQVETLASK